MRLEFESNLDQTFDLELCAKILKGKYANETIEVRNQKVFHVTQSPFFVKCLGVQKFDVLDELKSNESIVAYESAIP